MRMNATDFPSCPICSAESWELLYDGPVRDGGFGTTKQGQVARCSGCGADRLAERLSLQEEDYNDGSYRDHLGQGHDLQKYYAAHDELARFTLDTLWPESPRNKIVADVGSGAGTLLDHLQGIARSLIAIEPDQKFAGSLVAKGYRHFSGTAEAMPEFSGKVDVGFAIQVIEHVSDPKSFLVGIRQLLAPGGSLVVSTPNRADILLDLLPDDFPAFFYRTQHRWYFDAASLTRCAQEAGFSVADTRHVHRYGMANALLWLRDRKPSGRAALAGIDGLADHLWRSYLESSGKADNLYVTLKAN